MKTRHGFFSSFAVLLLTAIFSFTLAGCDTDGNGNGNGDSGDDNPFVGTWKSPEGGGDYVLVFTDNSFTITSPSGNVERGIYTYLSGDTSTQMLLDDGRRFNVSISGNSLSFGSRTYTKT
jgi:hypothetical protein